jgi:hypothetical protein
MSLRRPKEDKCRESVGTGDTTSEWTSATMNGVADSAELRRIFVVGLWENARSGTLAPLAIARRSGAIVHVGNLFGIPIAVANTRVRLGVVPTGAPIGTATSGEIENIATAAMEVALSGRAARWNASPAKKEDYFIEWVKGSRAPSA